MENFDSYVSQQVGIKHSPLSVKIDGVGTVEITSLCPSRMMQSGRAIQVVKVTPKMVDGKTMEYLRVDTRPAILALIEGEKNRRDAEFTSRYTGIYELINHLDSNSQHDEQFDRMMEDEYNDGVNPPSAPTMTREQARAKYPVANAYLTILQYAQTDPSSQTGFKKRQCGESAIDALQSGSDVIATCNQMIAEYAS